jgi:hypothetical protein
MLIRHTELLRLTIYSEAVNISYALEEPITEPIPLHNIAGDSKPCTSKPCPSE